MLPRFLIAPDKFKGSLTAPEVARAMARGIRRAIPSVKITLIPLADGGDGTASILGQALRARAWQTRVHGPLGHPLSATWWSRRSTAWLDFASASGLSMVPSAKRNPLKTSSQGVGELMRVAVCQGARHIILGVGGSATVDGGVGAMQALGIHFLDRNDRPIPSGGSGLTQLDRADLSGCVWRNQKIRVTILADVENPLLGSSGAATVFGPQKGATPAMVRSLALGLERLDRVIQPHHGQSLARAKHGGAAGGVVAGFLGLLGNVPGISVRVVRGIDFVLDTLNVESHIRNADWIITGEGRLDPQTLQGKTIAGLGRLAGRMHKPVIALAGKVDLSPQQVKHLGLAAAFAITPGPCTLDESQRCAAPWIEAAATRIGALLHRNCQPPR